MDKNKNSDNIPSIILTKITEFYNADDDKKIIIDSYKKLYNSVSKKYDVKKLKEIQNVTKFAIDSHSGQRRKSGIPFITHPIEVATIVSEEIDIGHIAIKAALLHDVVEDTKVTISDIEKNFGKNIANIVEGLTKIKKSTYKIEPQSFQTDNYLKLLLTMSEDIRVVLIKIADRLHNLRTLSSMTRNGQLKVVYETNYLYSPIAHKLGLYTIKSEMEDIWLEYTHPNDFNSISKKIKETKKSRREIISDFIKPLKTKLDKNKIKYRVLGRTKSKFSIWKKIEKKGIGLEEVYDLFAIRIVIDAEENVEKELCWKVYSLVAEDNTPHPNRLKDWISRPKQNGYQSLHSTVMDKKGRWIEVQIRTEKMDYIAEHGYAAHWKYKNSSASKGLDNIISKIKSSLKESRNSTDLVENLKYEILSEEVVVFTKDGESKTLPIGSSILDFAYKIHTKIGNTCKGAIVNSFMQSIGYKLKNGDKINILVDKNQNPKAYWLNNVITPKAKSKIKSYLNGENRRLIKKGESELNRIANELKIKSLGNQISNLLQVFNQKKKEDLLKSIGKGEISEAKLKEELTTKSIISKTIGSAVKRITRYSSIKKSNEKHNIIFQANNDIVSDYVISKCCDPVFGDDIFGIVTSNHVLKVHRVLCRNASDIYSKYAHKIHKVKWEDTTNAQEALAEIVIRGTDREGLLVTILETIKNHGVSVKSVNINSRYEIFGGNIRLFAKSVLQVNDIIKDLKKIKGVGSIKRKSIS